MLDISSIKPPSQWTPEDYYNAAIAQGYQLQETDNGYQWWGPGPDGESRRWRRGEDSEAIAPGDPQQYYNQQLEKAGYAMGGTQLQQWAARLGTTPEIAAQYIFGPGSQIINDPVHGEVVKAGTFDPNVMNNGWRIPDMQGFGHGALDGWADNGGVIALLAGGLTSIGGLATALSPSLGSMGANALVNGGLSAISGGNPLTGAVTGGLGAGLSSTLGGTEGLLAQNGITDMATQQAIIGAAKGGAGGLISGGDPLTAAVTGAAGGYATAGLNSLANGLSSPSMTYNAGEGAADPSQIDVSVNPDPYNNIPSTGADDVSFFEDILNSSFDPNATFQTAEGTINPAQIGDPSLIQSSGFNPDSVWQYITNQLDSSGAGFTPDPAVFQTPEGIINPAQIGQPAAAGTSIPSGVLAGIAKMLLGSGATSDQVRRLLTGRGFTPNGDNGILGDIFGSRGLVGTGLAMAPTLAAINYAINQNPYDTSSLQGLSGQIPTSYNFDQSGVQNVANQIPNFSVDTSGLTSLQQQVPTSYNFDTSKLTDAYNQFDPNSVTGQYDLNTAAARQGLASSLSARGVAGSSFGNSDMTNFGMTRDVGRQQLVNDAITRRAGIANDILSNDRSAAQLGLQGLGLQGQFANQAINAQQQNNAQNLQGLSLKNNMAQSLLDNQYKGAALGLQGQGLQRNIFGDVLNAQIASQKNKNDLYGRALLALSGGLSPRGASLF